MTASKLRKIRSSTNAKRSALVEESSRTASRFVRPWLSSRAVKGSPRATLKNSETASRAVEAGDRTNFAPKTSGMTMLSRDRLPTRKRPRPAAQPGEKPQPGLIATVLPPRRVVQLRKRDRYAQAMTIGRGNEGGQGRNRIEGELRETQHPADHETVALRGGRQAHAVRHQGIAEAKGPTKERREKRAAVLLACDDAIQRHLSDDLDIKRDEEGDMRRDDAYGDCKHEQMQGIAQPDRPELRSVAVVAFGDPGPEMIKAAYCGDGGEQRENENMALEIEHPCKEGRHERQQAAHGRPAQDGDPVSRGQRVRVLLAA